MKKIAGIIVLIAIIVLIGFGLTYKMVEPDGWDRIVNKVVEQIPVLENIIPEKTPQPTVEPTPTPDTVGDDIGPLDAYTTAEPTATPVATPTPTPTLTPTPEAEVDFENMTYEIYEELPGEVQEEFYDSFDSAKEFFEWYNKAKEEYDEANKNNIILSPDGSINLGDYINSSSEGN